MNCARFEARIHELFRGVLSAEERTAVEAHARECAACASLRRACEELVCRELVEGLPELLDGTLDASRRAVLERHLAVCPDCAAYVESYERTVALTAEAFADGAAEELPEELVQAILAARRSGRS